MNKKLLVKDFETGAPKELLFLASRVIPITSYVKVIFEMIKVKTFRKDGLIVI